MLKILHGMTEVAGQGYYTVSGLKKLGCSASMVVFKSNPLGYSFDKNLRINKNMILNPKNIIRVLLFFFEAVLNYNTYHFHFGKTLLPAGIDVIILKLLRKKVYVEFHGSEIRWKFCVIQKDESLYNYINETSTISRHAVKKIERICKFSDGIILHDTELYTHLPQKYSNVYYLPLRIDLCKFTPHFPELCNDNVMIVHAPSRRSIKGTEFIIQAINELKIKYKITFVLVENMSNDEALKVYEKADIIIDQLLIGTYGVFACEAMALGKPVITYIKDDIRCQFPSDLPIISSTTFEIKETIEELVKNADERRRIGQAGRRYVEKYHDYKKIALLALEIYEGNYQNVSCKNVFKSIINIDN